MNASLSPSNSHHVRKIAMRGMTFGLPLAALSTPTTLDAAVVDLTFSPANGVLAASGTMYAFAGGLQVATGANSVSGQFVSANNIIPVSASVTTTRSLTNTGFNSISYASAGVVTQYFAFKVPNAGTGWLKVRFDPGDPQEGNALIFLAGAYETTLDAGIHVGQSAGIPEPSSAALAGLATLAMGAAGVRRLRKDKAA